MSDSTAVRDFYDSASYLSRNAIIPVRAALVRELVGDQLAGARVLDLGCGDGSISRPLLAEAGHLTLVDFSAEMLNRARRSIPDGAAEFVPDDVLHYQAPEPFDIVLCVGVLAHVPSPRALISRVAQATRPGGLCIVQITDDGSPLGSLGNRYGWWQRGLSWKLNRMSRSDITLLAADHDLEEVGSRRYGLLVPGTGRLPYRWTLGLERWGARRPLSRLAAELLLAFRRS